MKIPETLAAVWALWYSMFALIMGYKFLVNGSNSNIWTIFLFTVALFIADIALLIMSGMLLHKRRIKVHYEEGKHDNLDKAVTGLFFTLIILNSIFYFLVHGVDTFSRDEPFVLIGSIVLITFFVVGIILNSLK